MKYLPFFFALLIIPTLLLSPVLVNANGGNGVSPTDSSTGVQKDIEKALQGVGGGAGFKTSTDPAGDLPKLVGKIINIFLSILGVLFVVLMVYGGYLWMTSYGDKTKVEKAKTLITDAVIGLIIIIAAYAISSFVVGELVKTTMT